MHYIISDIHGQITEFKDLLEKIDFDGIRDKMIIAGDVLDRGNYGIELIRYIEPYIETGTIKSLNKMTKESKENLYLFLKNLPVYEEIRTKYGKTIVTHSGLSANCIIFNKNKTINVTKSIEAATDINLYDFLLSDDIHRMEEYDLSRLDKFLIVGHVPVMNLNDDESNHIYRATGYMCIDTGASFVEKGGAMSCYCVKTDEQIYLYHPDDYYPNIKLKYR